MNVTNNLFDRLKDKLITAYRSKAASAEPADSRWQQNLMRTVRQMGTPQIDASKRPGFAQLAWRLAPAALALMIMLVVLIVRINDTLEFQVTGLMVNDPVQTYVTYEPL
jgi:hypothetical protein